MRSVERLTGMISAPGGRVSWLHALALPMATVRRVYRKDRERQAARIEAGLCTSCGASASVAPYGVCDTCLLELRTGP